MTGFAEGRFFVVGISGGAILDAAAARYAGGGRRAFVSILYAVRRSAAMKTCRGAIEIGGDLYARRAGKGRAFARPAPPRA
ncbi:MAG: hypothetical protein Tsb0010_05330 [Parvularculaceae bacterium]